MLRRSDTVDDDSHGDTARRADRRAIVILLGLAVLVHAATLVVVVSSKPSDRARSCGCGLDDREREAP